MPVLDILRPHQNGPYGQLSILNIYSNDLSNNDYAGTRMYIHWLLSIMVNGFVCGISSTHH